MKVAVLYRWSTIRTLLAPRGPIVGGAPMENEKRRGSPEDSLHDEASSGVINLAALFVRVC
jgi:hypothetical protein